MTDPHPSPNVHDTITLRNAHISPLLLLPAELRNAIYTHALTSSTGSYTFTLSPPIRTHTGLRVLKTIVQDASANPHRLALLRTCRQIHAEAHVLPFTLNGFQFASLGVFERTVVRLLAFQRAAITRISVTTTLGRALDAFLEYMRSDGYACARDVLPNVGSVEIRFSGKGSLIREFLYRSSRGDAWAESDKRRLVAWFKGGAGDVEVLVQEVR